MPPKYKFTRDEIITSVINIIRKDGSDAVTARSVAEELGASPKVIFGLFQNMDELRCAAISSANALYQDYIKEELQKAEYPAYKSTGMAYIRFAKEEKELFKLLFMRNRSQEADIHSTDSIENVLTILREKSGMDRETALLFHLQMWIHVHGIATMIATDYLDFDTESISAMISTAYFGLLHQFEQGEPA